MIRGSADEDEDDDYDYDELAYLVTIYEDDGDDQFFGDPVFV